MIILATQLHIKAYPTCLHSKIVLVQLNSSGKVDDIHSYYMKSFFGKNRTPTTGLDQLHFENSIQL